VAKNRRNHSKTLDIPTQLSRRLRRFSASLPTTDDGNSGTSRQRSKPAKLAPTSPREMSVESASYFMIGSRDLEKRVRFESACRSMTSADTFFAVTSRA